MARAKKTKNSFSNEERSPRHILGRICVYSNAGGIVGKRSRFETERKKAAKGTAWRLSARSDKDQIRAFEALNEDRRNEIKALFVENADLVADAYGNGKKRSDIYAFAVRCAQDGLDVHMMMKDDERLGEVLAALSAAAESAGYAPENADDAKETDGEEKTSSDDVGETEVNGEGNADVESGEDDAPETKTWEAVGHHHRKRKRAEECDDEEERADERASENVSAMEEDDGDIAEDAPSDRTDRADGAMDEAERRYRELPISRKEMLEGVAAFARCAKNGVIEWYGKLKAYAEADTDVASERNDDKAREAPVQGSDETETSKHAAEEASDDEITDITETLPPDHETADANDETEAVSGDAIDDAVPSSELSSDADAERVDDDPSAETELASDECDEDARLARYVPVFTVLKRRDDCSEEYYGKESKPNAAFAPRVRKQRARSQEENLRNGIAGGIRMHRAEYAADNAFANPIISDAAQDGASGEIAETLDGTSTSRSTRIVKMKCIASGAVGIASGIAIAAAATYVAGLNKPEETASLAENLSPVVVESKGISSSSDGASLGQMNSINTRQGILSVLNDDAPNPYHDLITVEVNVGVEFADYDGSRWTEGYIYQVGPGDVINLPKVYAKDGLTFVGWCQGGVPEEPMWGIFTTQVQMTEDVGNEKKTAIHALYADDDGNGYCSCGAYAEGVYKDGLEQYKQDYAEYLAELGRGDGAGAKDEK